MIEDYQSVMIQQQLQRQLGNSNSTKTLGVQEKSFLERQEMLNQASMMEKKQAQLAES